MSAVGEYEYVKQDRLGSETPILADVITLYADKAIAELEAQVSEQDRMLDLFIEYDFGYAPGSIKADGLKDSYRAEAKEGNEDE